MRPQGGPRRAERVVMLNWRDAAHPEGGGSEIYLERIAEHLVADGRQVTILCSHHGSAPRDEVLPSGVRVLRRGRRLSVYGHALVRLLVRDLGQPDVVVDVQNGVPFWTPLVTRLPVVLLCHHVHREQWPVVFGPLAARLGWWLESVAAPLVYRRNRYVTVSQVSRDELVDLGVDAERVAVIHNGVDAPAAPAGVRSEAQAPFLLVLGRLVPHKRVELAIDVLARLREHHPDLRLVVAGQGYWRDHLLQHALDRGVQDHVQLTGWVPDEVRSQLLAEARVLLVPSLKEGWGLTVMEAAAHETPAVGFVDAGGVAESIVDGRTGLLAKDLDDFVASVEVLLRDDELRAAMGRRASDRARTFSWAQTAARFAAVLDAAVGEPGASVRRGHADAERVTAITT